jgi:hypothetical protein
VDFLLILIPLGAALLVVSLVNRVDRRPAVRRDPNYPRWARGEIAKTGVRLVENLVIAVPTFLLVLWITGKAWS